MKTLEHYRFCQIEGYQIEVYKIRRLDSLCWNLSDRHICIRRQLHICRFLIIQISNFNHQKPANSCVSKLPPNVCLSDNFSIIKNRQISSLPFLFPQFVLWSNFFKCLFSNLVFEVIDDDNSILFNLETIREVIIFRTLNFLTFTLHRSSLVVVALLFSFHKSDDN